MFDSKNDVVKLAKDMGIKITGIDNIPKIKVSPILFEDGEDLFEAEGMKLTYSNFDDGRIEPLAKVSDQYALVQHYDAIGQVLQSFGELPEFGLNKVSVGMSTNGGKVWAKFKSSNPVTIKPGDDIFPEITMTNSCDTTKRFWLQWGAMRLVCTNGMMAPDDRIKGGVIKRLHKLGTLDIEEEILAFQNSFVQASESLGIWKEYAKIEMKKDGMLEVFKQMKISEKQGDEIMALPLRGDDTTVNAELVKGAVDGWTAYNAVTQWITDGSKNEATAITRGNSASKAFDSLVQ
jgi:hypothetical protein